MGRIWRQGPPFGTTCVLEGARLERRGEGIALERASNLVDGPASIVGLAFEMDRRAAAGWRSARHAAGVPMAAEDVYPDREAGQGCRVRQSSRLLRVIYQWPQGG